MNLFKRECFGIEIIIIIYEVYKHPVNKVAFQLQNNLIFKKFYCAFLHSITTIVGMSTRAPLMFLLWYKLQYNRYTYQVTMMLNA